MIRIETDKEINPGQLCAELGRVELRHVAGAHVEADTDEVTLRSALDAHVPDPDWTDPEAPPPPPDPHDELRDRIAAATTLEELQAALLGTQPDAGARVAGRPIPDAVA